LLLSVQETQKKTHQSHNISFDDLKMKELITRSKAVCNG